MNPASPHPGQLSPTEAMARHVCTLAAFLLPALSLCLPSGYSWGAGLLLLAALATAPRWWRQPLQWPRARWLVGVLLFVGIDWLIDAIISQGSWRGLDKPLKYFLALPCLFFALRFPPRPRALWAGLAVGACLSGAVALYQYGVLGEWRAEGFTNAIQYGNLSLLMAMMCLVGAVTWQAGPRAGLWRAGLGGGVALGLTASLLSQSRGGWLALAFALPALVILLRGRVPGRRLLGALAALAVCLGVLVTAMGPTLKQRLEQAVSEARQYEELGTSENSVGQRLAHWRLAWNMGLQKPLLGWTLAGYVEEKKRLVAAGQAPAEVLKYGHAHNEFLDVFAKRGLLGLSSVLALYGVVLGLFWPRAGCRLPPERHALQLAGLMLPLCYLGFGLTQAFLGHNSGTMFYLFVTLLLYAALQAPPEEDAAATPAAQA